jgi:hypothetical protein
MATQRALLGQWRKARALWSALGTEKTARLGGQRQPKAKTAHYY